MKINGKQALGIYIHIPFCKRKCLYCDFLSAPGTKEQMADYLEALLQEIKTESKEYEEYTVSTVFIGGGTPSILSGEQIGRIMRTLTRYYQVAADAEITIECNPGTATLRKLQSFYQSGINRLSIGLQSTEDEELRTLGRIHDWKDFQRTYEEARQAGFENINIDLMSALPGQTLASYVEGLKKVTALKPEHISAYSLIIEENTPFYEWYGGSAEAKEHGHLRQAAGEENVSTAVHSQSHPQLPDEDTERKMYHQTEKYLKEAGYLRYEISNYGKKGYACRHNLTYWSHGDYVGFGIGAASCVKGVRFKNTSDLNRYLKDFQIHEEVMKLTQREQMEEFMFLGLRLIQGISRKEFQTLFGREIEEVYGEVVIQLMEKKLMSRKGDRIRLTKRGIDVSNYVMAEFLL